MVKILCKDASVNVNICLNLRSCHDDSEETIHKCYSFQSEVWLVISDRWTYVMKNWFKRQSDELNFFISLTFLSDDFSDSINDEPVGWII